ncbi:MAG: hypothetical protein QOE92_154 [Chloroflexota bacterium]|jgi:uncharacterized membrane protein|nr:hypothetical protein [Chloroflexota bacterium]
MALEQNPGPASSISAVKSRRRFYSAIALISGWPWIVVAAMFANLEMQMETTLGPLRALVTIAVGLLAVAAAALAMSSGYRVAGRLILGAVAAIEACLWTGFVLWAGLGAGYSCWTPLCGT